MSGNAKGPFRADHVGSLLRPAKLQQARMQRERKNDEAAKVVPLEQLAISPQCGFSSTAEGNVISVDGERKNWSFASPSREMCGAAW